MTKGYMCLTGALGLILFMLCLQSPARARGLFDLPDMQTATPAPQTSAEAKGLFDLPDIPTASPTPVASAAESDLFQVPEQSIVTQVPVAATEESGSHKDEMTAISDGSSLFDALQTPEPTPFPTPLPRADKAESKTEGDFVFVQLNDGSVSIIAYTGKEANVSIPNIIQGLTVRSIGVSAFSDNENIQTIELPEVIETISEWAFSFCDNLVEVKIHEGLETIGDYAFAGCPSLTTIHIPSTVTMIGEDIFACENTRTSLMVWIKEGSYAEHHIKGKRYTISYEKPANTEDLTDMVISPTEYDTNSVSSITPNPPVFTPDPIKCPYCNGGYCKDCGRSGNCEKCWNQLYGPGTIECNRCYATGECGYCSYGYITTYKVGEGYSEKECSRCHGSGKCPQCDGHGYTICTRCNGTGNCPTCKGNPKCTHCDGTGWLSIN